MSKFERVARKVGVTPGALRDAMDTVGRERGRYHVSLTVKGVEFGRMAETRRNSAMWAVAELLRIEPEDLRDAIAEVYGPLLPGQVANISHRVRDDARFFLDGY